MIKNKKGFTLIELLAIIVILGIIMVITITISFSSVNKSRKNAVSVEAKNAVKWVSEQVTLVELNKANDDLANAIKTLRNKDNEDDNWLCLSSIGYEDGDKVETYDLFSAVGLTEENYIRDGSPITSYNYKKPSESNCSSIRIYDGNPEILLIANTKGKLSTGSSLNYAYSQNNLENDN